MSLGLVNYSITEIPPKPALASVVNVDVAGRKEGERLADVVHTSRVGKRRPGGGMHSCYWHGQQGRHRDACPFDRRNFHEENLPCIGSPIRLRLPEGYTPESYPTGARSGGLSAAMFAEIT